MYFLIQQQVLPHAQTDFDHDKTPVYPEVSAEEKILQGTDADGFDNTFYSNAKGELRMFKSMMGNDNDAGDETMMGNDAGDETKHPTGPPVCVNFECVAHDVASFEKVIATF